MIFRHKVFCKIFGHSRGTVRNWRVHITLIRTRTMYGCARCGEIQLCPVSVLAQCGECRHLFYKKNMQKVKVLDGRREVYLCLDHIEILK